MKSFDVLARTTSIHGSLLLEASAGTGKTFSIENIVARLLLEPPLLLLEEIAVVTFTREAAADLKNRIHRYLLTLLDLCHETLQGNRPKELPDFLLALIEKGELRKAKRHIERALAHFSTAQIFTIHGFCARMLQQHARNRCEGLGEASRMSEREKRTVLHDFFRCSLRPPLISPQQVELLLTAKGGIEKLEESLYGLIDKNLSIFPSLSYEQGVDIWSRLRREAPSKQDLLTEFHERIPYYKKPEGRWTKGEYEARVHRFIEAIHSRCDNEAFSLFVDSGVPWVSVFHPCLCKKNVKSLPLPRFPVWEGALAERWEPFWQKIASPPSLLTLVGAAAKKAVVTYREEEERVEFDDLLREMLTSLDDPAFQKAVRSLFRAAIIDEFQDTDPQQWEIFSRLFGSSREHFLHLVGDPKQSIYAFRQADIYTYLRAASHFPDNNRLSLSTNYRSTPSLIKGLNALFSEENGPPWIPLPRQNTFLSYPIVKAPQEGKQANLLDGKKGLHCWLVELEQKRRGHSPLSDLENGFFFPGMAREILSLRESQQIPFSSFCVLVRDRHQAARVIRYFERRDIPCHSQRREKLFEKETARSFYESLDAILHPRDRERRRRALADPLYGWSLDDLCDAENESTQEAIVAELLALRALFFHRGIASLFRAWLETSWNGKSVYDHLLQSKEKADSLHDLHRLVHHLVAYESERCASPDELLAYFARSLSGDEESPLALSDPAREGVIIQTMHASKGLEYEIVFALGLITPTPQQEEILRVEREGEAVLIPAAEASRAEKEAYLDEIDAEKMRQLYVTLTRAKERVYLPLPSVTYQEPPKKGSASPIELFLERRGWNGQAMLRWLREKGIEISWEVWETSPAVPERHEKERSTRRITPPVPLHFHFPQREKISFTQWKQRHGRPPSLRRERPYDSALSRKTIHTLPAGPETGIYIHSLLEKLPFDRIGEETRAFIESEPCPPSLEGWESVIALQLDRLMQKTLRLHGEPFRFADLAPDHSFREVDFMYAQEENRLVQGVIDLVFLFRDRIYLVDWKTNWLGPDAAAYSQQGLQQAMEENDYLIQAEWYAEAWRRYGKPYPLGGILYVFFRGIEEEGIWQRI